MLLDLAEVTSKGQSELLMSMLYPSDSHLDDNPIFILCRNDPCSFTWTGESHIQQVRVHRRGRSCFKDQSPVGQGPYSMSESSRLESIQQEFVWKVRVHTIGQGKSEFVQKQFLIVSVSRWRIHITVNSKSW